MNKDYRDLINRLFATQLSILENATTPASLGQQQGISAKLAKRMIDEVDVLKDDIGAISGAIRAVIRLDAYEQKIVASRRSRGR
jgi:hypothetical protein